MVDLETYSRVITPHNAYIHAILRIGIVGLIFIIFQVLTTIIIGIKKKDCLVVCVSMMILTMWIGYTYNPNIAFFYGLIMHLISMNNKKEKKEIK